MKKKPLGNRVWDHWAMRLARIAPSIRHLVFVRVAVTVLMIPSGVAADASSTAVSPPSAGSPRSTTVRISDPTARAVELDLGGVFLTQKDSGAYAFSEAHAGIATYPLMASMSLDAYYTIGNKSTLSQATYSVARYYTYLMGSQDRDGDCLIESSAPWGGKDARAEDPAYNAILSVDMRALARANFELRRTLPSLYWYDTSRCVARAVVSGTYDGDAGYFFPSDAATNRSVRQWSALASLPVVFDEFVGPNHGDALVTRHLMRWATDFAARGDDSEVSPTQRAVERLVGVSVMRATHHDTSADALRSLRVLSNATVESVALYATERAMLDRPLRDPDLALDLFYAIVRSSQKFPDSEVVRIEKSLPDVRALAGGFPISPVEAGEQSVRTIYGTVAQLRDKLRASSFWTPEERAAFPGADATIATGRLLDDVSAMLRRAENSLYTQRFGAAGLRIATQFPKDSAVNGEYAILNWELSATGKTFEIKQVLAGVYGEALTPVNAGKPFAVAPGAPRRFAARHLLKGNAGTMRLVTYMIMIEDAAGNRARYYVERSVYANTPVGILARFPRGRIMTGARVPIELDMTRRGRGSDTTRYYWFSPSGLRLAEGNQGALAFGADSTRVTLNVEIPTPCRPGVFPFTLKFVSGEREAGTIQASLFKPYQWAFVGPFAGGSLDKKFAPENGVVLLNAYDAGKRKVQWRPVPASATGPLGEVVMQRLIDAPGVSYLYTVVAVAYETDLSARLASNCPAALYVNGKRVLANTGAAGDSTSGIVHLHGDKNHILIKMVGDATATIAFGLGSDDNIATDEFNNDLAELVEGYQELLARAAATNDVPSEARRLVTFTYEDPVANAVSVVGSFNGWSPETHRLQKTAEGRWELTLSLAPGRYPYRFLVDQKKQVLDPSTTLREPDGYGGQNSVVVVKK